MFIPIARLISAGGTQSTLPVTFITPAPDQGTTLADASSAVLVYAGLFSLLGIAMACGLFLALSTSALRRRAAVVRRGVARITLLGTAVSCAITATATALWWTATPRPSAAAPAGSMLAGTCIYVVIVLATAWKGMPASTLLRRWAVFACIGAAVLVIVALGLHYQHVLTRPDVWCCRFAGGPLYVVQLATLLTTGMLAGLFFVWSSAVADLRQMSVTEGIEAALAANRIGIHAAPLLLYSTALACTVLAAAYIWAWGDGGRWGERAALLGLTATGLYIFGVGFVTLERNLPLARALAAADAAAAPMMWRIYLRDWTKWNHVRVIASAVACALLIGGAWLDLVTRGPLSRMRLVPLTIEPMVMPLSP